MTDYDNPNYRAAFRLGHGGVGRKQHFLPPNEPLYGTRRAGDA